MPTRPDPSRDTAEALRQSRQRYREAEEFQAFLLKLSDALRPLADPAEIQGTASRTLGEYLGANRVCYVEVTETESIVRQDYVSGVPSIVGRWKNADFGKTAEALRTGRTNVKNDIEKMPGLSEPEREAYRAIGVAAQIVVTLFKDGRWIANFGVHSATPRVWTKQEVQLVEETAERTWAAVESAHHQAALRASEEKYRALFDSMSEYFYLLEVIRDGKGEAIDVRYLEENAASVRLVGTVRGKRLAEINPAFDRGWLAIVDRVSRTGMPERFEQLSEVTGRWHDYHVFAAASGKDHVGVLSSDVTDRKRAQDALRESEERLRMALDAGRMGTWRFDLATGRQQWSDQQFRLFGLEPGKVPPDRELFLSLVHPDDHHLIEFGPGDLLPGAGLLDAEFRIRRPDGEVRWLVAHTIVRRDDADNPVEMIGLNWDITERKQAEDALRNSEQGLRIALEAGRMGTYRFDVHTGIEEWSDGEYELLGVTRTAEPPTRELFLSIVHPDDHHLVQYTAEDRRPEGTSLDSEFRIIRPDTGEVRTITSHALARFGPDGKPVELIGVNRDVTEERRARAALRSTEERLQQFSDASSDVLWIRDAKALQWEYLSPAFDKIYGLTRQDALRGNNYRSWLDLILPDDREFAQAAIERVRAGERAAFEYRIRRPDGQVRWLRDTDFPMRDESGTVTHIGGVGSDITGLKQAEEHQRTLLAELQHRVRNTLAVIRSIARRTASTSESVEAFAMNLDGRIDAFSRVQAEVTRDPLAGMNLAVMIAEEMRAASAREGDTLTIDGPTVRLRPKAAETVVLGIHELATNAIKYGALAGDGGRIRISWFLSHDPPTLNFTWKESGVSVGSGAPRRRGLGTEVLTQTIPYELSATALFELEPDGLRYTLALPVSTLVTGGAPA